MRNFSTNVQNVLYSDDVRHFFLIKLEFSQNYYLTSLPYNVNYQGNLYTADGGLFEVDSPRFSTVVDREAYKVVIADLLNEMSAEFRAGVIGKPINVLVGFLDANGAPLLTPADVIQIYKGYVDSPSISNNWDERLAVVEGTSPMADLDSVNVIYSSKDGMDQLSATDTSFDEIYDGAEIATKWGKI